MYLNEYFINNINIDPKKYKNITTKHAISKKETKYVKYNTNNTNSILNKKQQQYSNRKTLLNIIPKYKNNIIIYIKPNSKINNKIIIFTIIYSIIYIINSINIKLNGSISISNI